MKPSCKTCGYFETDSYDGGLCRRYPPQGVAEREYGGDSTTAFHFPFLQDDDWCGEWVTNKREIQVNSCVDLKDLKL